jgi:ATP-dependent DNA ligase
MPDETVIDGEIVAMEAGRPSFNALQNYGSSTGALYYVFDVMVVAGKEVTSELLVRRRNCPASGAVEVG